MGTHPTSSAVFCEYFFPAEKRLMQSSIFFASQPSGIHPTSSSNSNAAGKRDLGSDRVGWSTEPCWWCCCRGLSADFGAGEFVGDGIAGGEGIVDAGQSPQTSFEERLRHPFSVAFIRRFNSILSSRCPRCERSLCSGRGGKAISISFKFALVTWPNPVVCLLLAFE